MKFHIKEKIIIVIAICLILSLGANTLIGIYQFQKTYTNALQSKVSVVGKDLRNSIVDLLDLGFELENVIGINERCNKIINEYEEIDYCYVINEKNLVLHHNNKSFVGNILKGNSFFERNLDSDTRVESTLFEEEPVYEIILDINNNGIKDGELRLGLPKKIIEKEKSKMFQQAIIVVITSFFIIFLLSFYLAKAITSPIESLTKAAEAISDGNLNYKINIHTKDEFEELGFVFNNMKKDLKKSRIELEKYNQDLEKKVKERTKELEKKNAELEKFNALIIGRELRMIELKKNINDLEKKVKKN
jgi:methyl-accepting chemotaxis protein